MRLPCCRCTRLSKLVSARSKEIHDRARGSTPSSPAASTRPARPTAWAARKSASSPRAVKATHPAHFDVEAARELGYTDLVAPPTFAIIVAQRADAQLIEDPEAGIDFSRVVHADQRFIHHRPIIAGDELVAELHVDQVRAMGGGAMITTRARSPPWTGEKTATTTSSILVTRGGPVTVDHLNELSVGQEIGRAAIEVTRADLVRYAGASGDFNPIHWNERFAEQVGPARRHRPWHVHDGRCGAGR